MAREMGLEDQEGVVSENEAPPAYEEVIGEVSGATEVIGILLSAPKFTKIWCR